MIKALGVKASRLMGRVKFRLTLLQIAVLITSPTLTIISARLFMEAEVTAWGESIGGVLGKLAIAAAIIGFTIVMIGVMGLPLAWLAEGCPEPKTGWQTRRAEKRLAEKQSALALEEAELRSLKEQFLSAGERIAAKTGANPLWATLHAHRALEELVSTSEKVKHG